MTIAIWSFVICLLAMTSVGALSVLKKKKQPKDYLLASQEVPAWLSALSAVSTNNSGFMFIFVGITLAGLFAAIVSTADSQIIVCSGSLTHDIFPQWEKSYTASKIGTLTVTMLALSIALFAPEGVFGLVLIAWSAMGASLGSILILSLFGQRPPQAVALSMMAVAIVVVVFWQVTNLDEHVLEMFPAMVAAFAVYGGWQGYRLVKRGRK